MSLRFSSIPNLTYRAEHSLMPADVHCRPSGPMNSHSPV